MEPSTAIPKPSPWSSTVIESVTNSDKIKSTQQGWGQNGYECFQDNSAYVPCGLCFCCFSCFSISEAVRPPDPEHGTSEPSETNLLVGANWWRKIRTKSPPTKVVLQKPLRSTLHSLSGIKFPINWSEMCLKHQYVSEFTGFQGMDRQVPCSSWRNLMDTCHLSIENHSRTSGFCICLLYLCSSLSSTAAFHNRHWLEKASIG